jgi:hypothetical protein
LSKEHAYRKTHSRGLKSFRKIDREYKGRLTPWVALHRRERSAVLDRASTLRSLGLAENWLDVNTRVSLGHAL